MSLFRNLMRLCATYYDKLIAVAVLIAMIGTGGVLAVRLGALHRVGQDFAAWMDAIRPRHPRAAEVDVVPYQTALSALETPHQIPAWSNALFVPEVRCWCVDCRRPITLDTEACPFCGFQQPDPEGPTDRDSDGDGIPDKWELEQGFDPRSPVDAGLDTDGDGFSNLEEYLAGTDPRDPASTPPIVLKLSVASIDAVPFELLFRSKSKLPDGLRFAINTRKRDQTYFRRLGEEVEGFELVDFDERYTEVVRNSVPIRVEVSVLTLKRADRLIPLPMGQQRSYFEYSADLVFAVDGSRYTVKPGDTFDLLDNKYEVIAIDIEKETVVIMRLSDDRRFTVRKHPDTLQGGS